MYLKPNYPAQTQCFTEIPQALLYILRVYVEHKGFTLNFRGKNGNLSLILYAQPEIIEKKTKTTSIFFKAPCG